MVSPSFSGYIHPHQNAAAQFSTTARRGQKGKRSGQKWISRAESEAHTAFLPGISGSSFVVFNLLLQHPLPPPPKKIATQCFGVSVFSPIE